MKRTMLAVLLVLAVGVSVGCNRTKGEAKAEPLSVNDKAEEQASQQTSQAVLPAKSVSVQTDAERPIFQWAGMVAVGDDPERVNTALKLVHYPPLDCSLLHPDWAVMTCNTASDDGMVTANFGKGNRLISLESWSKDAERTNYRGLKSGLTAILGAPRVDHRHGTRLIWNQSDGSRVDLQWFEGTYAMHLWDRTVPLD